MFHIVKKCIENTLKHTHWKQMIEF
jgi:hypothetical protein